jgi:hypothetical protein
VKSKTNELASLGDSIDLASVQSMPGPLPGVHLLVPVAESTGEQPAEFCRQLGIPEGRETYAAALDVPIDPPRSGGLSRPTANV